MSTDDVMAWAAQRDQYRTWLAQYLDAGRIGFVQMVAGTAHGQRIQRVTFRLPDGAYVTLDAVLRANQAPATQDTADDVAARIIRWVKGRDGRSPQGVVV